MVPGACLRRIACLAVLPYLFPMNRSAKRQLVRLFNPLDLAARTLTGQSHLPPLHLRWDAGPLRGFVSSAAEYRVYLKLFAGLTLSSRVLDIGCGCGQTALELMDQLGPEGTYVGCDINREAIAWCNRHISARDHRFSFHHINVRNGMYNPNGSTPAEEYLFPVIWGKFDIILLKSVFTHLKQTESERYMAQLPAFLAPGGCCLVSFFLMNDVQRALAAKGENRIQFIARDGAAAYANPEVPEAIVALEESAVESMIARAGLMIVPPVRYGTWSGRSDGLSHQDLLLLRAAARENV